jgi:chromosome segregation ATPase
LEPTKPEAIEATPLKPSPVVSKKVAKKQQSKAGNRGNKDLLSIVEKTVMNDFEAQQLIDVLLNKQSGNFSAGDNEWVEQGKMSETSKLQKQIAELEKAMEEETAKGKSFKDKMTELRRELNEEKSAKAATTRMIEELNNSRTQETNNLNNKLQQVQYDMTQQITIIQTQLNQQVQHNHQMELDQTHYLATIENLNQQLKKANETAMNSTASAANDQHIL